MQQKIFGWMLFWVLLPGVLLAQERKLKGKVVRVGEQDEQIAEVGLTVTLDESGDTDNTNSQGLFGVFLPDRFKAGEKVTLSIDKEGWRIQYPLDGEVRIPAELEKELVEVCLLPKGSKLFWTADRIEKFIVDIAEEAKQQVSPEGNPKILILAATSRIGRFAMASVPSRLRLRLIGGSLRLRKPRTICTS